MVWVWFTNSNYPLTDNLKAVNNVFERQRFGAAFFIAINYCYKSPYFLNLLV
ncbi:hypothetical protein PROVRUST_05502 [Providencia rustigianii DSM 4541]|uniref:Uncharacterized protein n=1 Tax=Providencia rustigianii DSM 4541 TaxID=500637 RepID=D1NZZ3_9GAMM|nr:hypothetical protein PROVRUST_05502 [Providencia rustigianii DSM 4541]